MEVYGFRDNSTIRQLGHIEIDYPRRGINFSPSGYMNPLLDANMKQFFDGISKKKLPLILGLDDSEKNAPEETVVIDDTRYVNALEWELVRVKYTVNDGEQNLRILVSSIPNIMSIASSYHLDPITGAEC